MKQKKIELIEKLIYYALQLNGLDLDNYESYDDNIKEKIDNIKINITNLVKNQ